MVGIGGRNSPYVSRHRVEIGRAENPLYSQETAAVLLKNDNHALLLTEEEEKELENAVCIPVPSHMVLQRREGLFPFPAWVPSFINEKKIVYAIFPDAFRGYDEEGNPLFKNRYVSRVGEVVLEDTRPSLEIGVMSLFLEDEGCEIVTPEKTPLYIKEGEKVKMKEIKEDVWIFETKYLPKIREFLGRYGYVVRRTLRLSEEEIWYEKEALPLREGKEVNMFLKEVVHDINAVFTNTKPETPTITLTFGTLGVDGHRTTEGSFFAFYPSVEVECSERVDYIELLNKLQEVYPRLRYEKVYPILHIRFKNAKIYFDHPSFGELMVLEYNGKPQYPEKFQAFVQKMREGSQNYMTFESLTLKGEVTI